MALRQTFHSTCWIPLDLQYEARRAGSVECAARSEHEWVRRCLSKCLCVFRERERVCPAQLHNPRLHSVASGHTHHIHKDTQAENCSVTTLSRQAYVIQHLDAVKNKTPINMHRNTLHRLSTVICSNLIHAASSFSPLKHSLYCNSFILRTFFNGSYWFLQLYLHCFLNTTRPNVYRAPWRSIPH